MYSYSTPTPASRFSSSKPVQSLVNTPKDAQPARPVERRFPSTSSPTALNSFQKQQQQQLLQRTPQPSAQQPSASNNNNNALSAHQQQTANRSFEAAKPASYSVPALMTSTQAPAIANSVIKPSPAPIYLNPDALRLANARLAFTTLRWNILYLVVLWFVSSSRPFACAPIVSHYLPRRAEVWHNIRLARRYLALGSSDQILHYSG